MTERARAMTTVLARELVSWLRATLGHEAVVVRDPSLGAELTRLAPELVAPAAGRDATAVVVTDPDEIDHRNPGATVIVVAAVASVDEIDKLFHHVAAMAVVGGVDVVAGHLVVTALPAGSGAPPAETGIQTDPVALLASVTADLWRIVDHRASDHRSEIERLEGLLDAAHDDAAKERQRLVGAHRRDVRQVRESTRYQVGSIAVGALAEPRTIIRAPRRLWDLWRRRTRPEPGDVPQHEGSVAPRRALTVGYVLDEFSASCFAREADLVPLRRSDPRDQLDATGCDLVLVESAWRGNGGTWNYLLNRYGEHDPNPVDDVLDWCRTANVPAVFWNKEDPVNYDVFIDVARAFPRVLTTDAAIVDRYRQDLGHDRVAPLPFAAQAAIHNPIGSRRSVTPKVCFAGAWRGDKYQHRSDDFELLLDPLLSSNRLDIYDRYADHPQRDRLAFPDPYRSRVVGTLPYDRMVLAYRQYAAFLNVNSVVDSPTMCSRRVFELLACGTPVISTYSRAIDEMLGEHVLVPTTPSETAEMVDLLITDVEERERRGHLGYRFVHQHHTYRQRFEEILDFAEVPFVPSARPLVSVLAVSNRPERFTQVLDAYERQTYPSTELIFVANSSRFDRGEVTERIARLPRGRALFIDDSATLGECLNAAARVAEGDYLAKFDDDDDYGAEYLGDMMLTFEYSGADVAGKRSYYAYLHESDQTVLRMPGREFAHVPQVVGGTLVIDRRATAGIDFQHLPRGTDTAFLEDCRASGLRIFSGDRYNFVQHRYADPARHTWQISREKFLERAVHVASGYAADRIFI